MVRAYSSVCVCVCVRVAKNITFTIHGPSGDWLAALVRSQLFCLWLPSLSSWLGQGWKPHYPTNLWGCLSILGQHGHAAVSEGRREIAQTQAGTYVPPRMELPHSRKHARMNVHGRIGTSTPRDSPTAHACSCLLYTSPSPRDRG